MTIVLAVDTSSEQASVALRRADGSVGVATWHGTASHSRYLVSRIEGLLSEAGLTVRDVEMLAGVVGPGSYTGVRIGLACLTGLSLVSSRPTVGVSSLQAMAWAAGAQSTPIIAVRNGYRRDVFFQAFDAAANPLSPPGLVSIDNLAAIEHGPGALWVGDGVAACTDAIGTTFGDDAIGPPLGALAAPMARHCEVPSPGRPASGLVPLYIRPVDIGVPRSA